MTAVPGLDYTPMRQTIALTPNSSSSLTIPILPGPAALGTRTLEVTIPPSPAAPQGSAQLIVIQHGPDKTPPHIVDSQALTQRGRVVAFSIQFSEPMALGPVTNLANYSIAAPRSSKEVAEAVFNQGSVAPYSKTIPLKSATYDAASNTVYLVPVDPVRPSGIRSLYSFQVLSPAPANAAGFSNLTDNSGNPINSYDSADSIDGHAKDLPRLVKVSPAISSSLFGTPAHAVPRGRVKPQHQADRIVGGRG